MTETTTDSPFAVRIVDGTGIIAILGDVTPASEVGLATAFTEASATSPAGVVLDFTGLDYMNSGGIGLLVTILVRARRNKQSLAAFGLSDHYRQIFELTRLDDAIALHDSEAEAVGAVGSGS